ncbi:Para-aminobenzoate synthase, aminase component, partial [hydrothermal vent metagenome]
MHKIDVNRNLPFKRKVFVRETKWIEPASLFLSVAKKPEVVWLDSGMNDAVHKWSYIMWEPELVLDGASEKFSVKKNGETIKSGDDPFDLLKNLLAETLAYVPAGAPPFSGGVAGFFGYGLLRNCEPSTIIRKNQKAREGDIWLGFYNGVIAFDHESCKTFLVLNLPEGAEPELAFAELERELQNAKDVKFAQVEPVGVLSSPQSNFTRQEYLRAVERVRSYIEDGDCYQVNISQKFSVSGDYDPVALYLKLRSINPAPFASYINTGPVQILSSSPERFILLKNGIAETRPVKGTRPRGKTGDDDNKLRHELLDSDKERAENVMIVDLMRNDLSKV